MHEERLTCYCCYPSKLNMGKEMRSFNIPKNRHQMRIMGSCSFLQMVALTLVSSLLFLPNGRTPLHVNAFTSHCPLRRNHAKAVYAGNDVDSPILPPSRVSGAGATQNVRRPTTSSRRRPTPQADGSVNKDIPTSIPRLSEILEGESYRYESKKHSKAPESATAGSDHSSGGSETPQVALAREVNPTPPQNNGASLPKRSDSSDNKNVDARAKSSSRSKKGNKGPPERAHGSSTTRRQSRGDPWKAGYYTSLKSQKRIKDAGWSNNNQLSVQRAAKVLETFLSIPPERCNPANLVCALTLSAKVMSSQTNDKFRALLFRALGILETLLASDALSARQLCNVAWAIAKQYDRDDQILPPDNEPLALSSDHVVGQAETWDLRNDLAGCPRQRADRIVDQIATKLAAMLAKDPLAAKEGELCMASWAYGILRKRRRPPGWHQDPQLGLLPQAMAEKQTTIDTLDVIKFEQWTAVDDDEVESTNPTDELFDIIGDSLLKNVMDSKNASRVEETSCRVRVCRWNELANVAWAFASHGRSSEHSVGLLTEIAHEAARRLSQQLEVTEKPRSRDVAQIIWALGTLQADNYRLADGLLSLIDAVASSVMLDIEEGNNSPFERWSCADLVQTALALAHARVDDSRLLKPLYAEALRRLDSGLGDKNSISETRKEFLAWELSILLWAQARLYLTSSQGHEFESFVARAVQSIQHASGPHDFLSSIGLGLQEQANMAWSLAILQHYDTSSTRVLLLQIFDEAAAASSRDGVIQLEHAHQLWQSLFLLENECPEVATKVPRWFYEALQDKWLAEKSRAKLSSARHRSISQTLNLMGVAHFNEHDEDIDVAIVLKQEASWTHETERLSTARGMKVAVEFDGPNHFTRQRQTRDGSKPTPPRTLGHTVLKYRLLKHQGWTVVRVPYYEYDKIPFWASMERQRYLQRLLKTHGNLRFSQVDISAYKAPVANRRSRFD